MAFLCRIRENLRILLMGLLLSSLAGCAGLIHRRHTVPTATAEAARRLPRRRLDCWQQREMPKSRLPGAQAPGLRAITSNAPR